ncbi:MAG: DUF962 domain-containing protein [Bdellovibrionota bacterium]
MPNEKRVPIFKTFAEFWPYYLSEHSNRWNQRLHAVGTTLALFVLVAGVVSGQPLFFLGAVVAGYFFAWIGHFVVERNRPATFTYPFWSLLGDFKMYGLFVTGQLRSAQDAAATTRSKTSMPS